MRNRIIVILILGVITIVSLAYLESIGVIDIRGIVRVHEERINVNPSTINIELNIESESGKQVYKNIATIEVHEKEGLILFKPIERRAKGNISLILSGEVILESKEKIYTIKMPCLMSVNSPCFRVLTIIPGYDVPLKLNQGEYNVTIKLSWSKALGEGEIQLKIIIVTGEGKAYLIPVGQRPTEETRSWVMANGSTKCFALLVDNVKVKAVNNGCGEIKAWAWMFSPTGCKNNIFVFKLIDAKNGDIVAKLELPIEKSGLYYQVLLLVKAKIGEYVLEVTYPTKVKLSIKLVIEG